MTSSSNQLDVLALELRDAILGNSPDLVSSLLKKVKKEPIAATCCFGYVDEEEKPSGSSFASFREDDEVSVSFSILPSTMRSATTKILEETYQNSSIFVGLFEDRHRV